MQPDIDYRLKPSPELKRTWGLTALALWLISSPVYALLLAPTLIDPSVIFLPSGYWAPIGMFLPCLALGLLIAILWHRTAPVIRVFRITRARLLGTLAFWTVLPMAGVAIFPISAGYIAMQSLLHIQLHLTGDTQLAMIAFALLGVSYIIACLLSHGMPHLGKRLAGYLLMWLGCLSLTAAAGMEHRLVL